MAILANEVLPPQMWVVAAPPPPPAGSLYLLTFWIPDLRATKKTPGASDSRIFLGETFWKKRI